MRSAPEPATHASMACRAMCSPPPSGKASINRPPFSPDGKLATWALTTSITGRTVAWRMEHRPAEPLCVLCVYTTVRVAIGRPLRGTGGPPVRWFVIVSISYSTPRTDRIVVSYLFLFHKRHDSHATQCRDAGPLTPNTNLKCTVCGDDETPL